MDFPDAHTPPLRPSAGRAAAGIGLLALALYGVFLTRHIGAVAGASDSSGYMNHARLLASGSVHAHARTIPGLPPEGEAPYLNVPLGFRPAWNGDGLVPTYPAGLPLLILALAPLAGWGHAAGAVMVLHSLAGLAATYALGRALGLGILWAALAPALLALSPLYLFSSLQLASDVPSLAWTTLAVLAALRSRRNRPWALAAGAAVAVDVLLRPTNVLAFIPVAVALGASPRSWALLALGGLPGAAFFLAHSHAAYGSFLATGYGDVSPDFGMRYVPGTLLHYGRWLPALLTPLVALNLALPWVRRATAGARLLLVAWMIPFAAFFTTYRCTHEVWWYLRFLLPAFPAMAVGSLIVLRAALSLIPAPMQRAASFAGMAATLALAAVLARRLNGPLHPLSIGDEELWYPRLAAWMRVHVPDDAVCLTRQASGALFYYTGATILRWDFVDGAHAGGIESAIRRSGKPLYAVLFPAEYGGARLPQSAMPGRWTEVGGVDEIRIMRRDFGAPGS